jgi:hypothetical protein
VAPQVPARGLLQGGRRGTRLDMGGHGCGSSRTGPVNRFT